MKVLEINVMGVNKPSFVLLLLLVLKLHLRDLRKFSKSPSVKYTRNRQEQELKYFTAVRID